MLIFFDTEFTDLHQDARLISIGFVSEDGKQTFYAELTDTYQVKDCSDFVKQHVLPMLDGGDTAMTLVEMVDRLLLWFSHFNDPVRLATDSMAWDWRWIQKIFREMSAWPENVDRKPAILGQDAEMQRALEHAFSCGLRPHHALDDAKANRQGWFDGGQPTFGE